MKKLLLVLVMVGTLFTMTSFKKTCECKTYWGKAPTTEVVVGRTERLEDYENYGVKKCSDLDKKVPELTGFECR